MLHDVLMALAGHPGDIIVESDSAKGGYTVSRAYNGVSNAERKVINSIVDIGYKYRCLEEFCRQIRTAEYGYIVATVLDHGVDQEGILNRVRNDRSRKGKYPTQNDAASYNGYYASALCGGIEDYLERYRAKLVTVEKVVLSDSTLPLSTISLLLEEQKQIIDELLHIVGLYCTELNRKRRDDSSSVIRGDEILALLEREARNQKGNGVYGTIYSRCLDTFKVQLKSWICHGQLDDPKNEFLIGKRKLVSGSLENAAGVRELKDFLFEHLYEELNSEASGFEWDYMFYLRTKDPRWQQCPYHTWRDILFLGKAARMLIRRYHNEEELEERASVIFNDWDTVCSSPGTFEAAIVDYRLRVTQAFWRYLNEHLDVKAHFDLFRQIYMLGCHDMYTEFMESSWFTMQTRCSLSAYSNIRPNFWKTIGQALDSNLLLSGNKTASQDVDLIHGSIVPAARSHFEPFRIGGVDLLGASDGNLSLFDFRLRLYQLNLSEKGFITVGDTAYIDNEMVLNISEDRLQAPLSNSLNLATVWFENMVHVTDGFESVITVELSQLDTAYMYTEEKMRGTTLGRYCRFSLVLQSKVEPTKLGIAYATGNLWHLLKDYFTIEFVVDYDNLGSQHDSLAVAAFIILGGECVSAVSGEHSPINRGRAAALCINMDSKRFKITTGGRPDFSFTIRVQISHKYILMEMEHAGSLDTLKLETNVMDATQTLPHDFGDSYVGIISTPYDALGRNSKLDLSKRNCILRISQWDFAASMSQYDMYPFDDNSTPFKLESFHKELPQLRNVEFESGINHWMHSTVTYRSSWPVSIILNLPTMLCYNSIFQFMFLLRRCVYGLQMLCYIHRSMRAFRRGRRLAPLPNICRRPTLIRWRMHTFMMTMFFYVQQCVVERNYAKLRSCVSGSDCFQEIKETHDVYLKDIAVNCFLCEEAVIQPLLRCMDVSMKFATLYYCAFNGSCGTDMALVMTRLDEYHKVFEMGMSQIMERLLLLSREKPYATLNTFLELCNPMQGSTQKT